MLNEIVADKQRNVVLRFSNREVVELPISIDIPDAVQLLAALAELGTSGFMNMFSPLTCQACVLITCNRKHSAT